MALSTNQKIAIAVGVTAAVVLVGAVVLAESKKANFDTRNIEAINAVVDAMAADPNIPAATLTNWADQMAYYGLTEQAAKLRAKVPVAPKYTQQEVQSGITKLWEQQAKQGFW